MLLDQIQQDLKQSQLDRNETKTSTLRLVLSEIKNTQINKGAPLEDADIVTVIRKEIKKRTEAATAFKNAGRAETAAKEESESEILSAYLPDQISSEELTKIIEETITNLGATNMADMGRVIGAVMGKVGQGADGSQVSAIIKEKLQS